MSFSRNNQDLVTRAATGLRMVVETLALPSADDVALDFDTMRGALGAFLGNFPLTQRPTTTPLTAQAWVAQLASAGRTTTTAGPDQTNAVARGLIVVLDLTAFVTAASLQLTVEQKLANATYSLIAAGPVLTAVNKSVLLIDPLAGAEPAEVGDSVSAGLPAEWRVRCVHGNGNSHTYSVTAYPIR